MPRASSNGSTYDVLDDTDFAHDHKADDMSNVSGRRPSELQSSKRNYAWPFYEASKTNCPSTVD